MDVPDVYENGKPGYVVTEINEKYLECRIAGGSSKYYGPNDLHLIKLERRAK